MTFTSERYLRRDSAIKHALKVREAHQYEIQAVDCPSGKVHNHRKNRITSDLGECPICGRGTRVWEVYPSDETGNMSLAGTPDGALVCEFSERILASHLRNASLYNVCITCVSYI